MKSKILTCLILVCLGLAVSILTSGCVPEKTMGFKSVAILPFEDYSGQIGSSDNADFVRRIIAYQFNPFRFGPFWPVDSSFDPLINITGLQAEYADFGRGVMLKTIDETDAALDGQKINTPSKIREAKPEKLAAILGVEGIVMGQIVELKSEVVSDYFNGFDFRVGQEYLTSTKEGETIKVNYIFPLLDATATSEGIGARRNFSVAQKITEVIKLKVVNCKTGKTEFSGKFELTGIRPYAVVMPDWNYSEKDFICSDIFGSKIYPSIYFYYYMLMAKGLSQLSQF